MQYLLDTVTIVRHFCDEGKIGKAARDVLDNAENQFVISVISLMEIMYLSEKNRIEISLSETLDRIESSSLYTTVDLTPEILKVTEKTDFGELHDRLNLSTCKWLGVPIISSDKSFETVEGVRVIWK